MHMKTTPLIVLLFCTLLAPFASAQVPTMVNYQGRVAVGGTNFDGAGQFKFALVNAAGSATFWSNDGTSVAGSQPTAFVPLTVTRGLYSVLLGDTALAGMTQVIPVTVFTNADVRLRVWFNDGVTGFQLLSPDQRIAAVGYAMMAANVPDGIITSNKIANGAINGSKIADFSITSSKLSSNSITSGQLADVVALGLSNVVGRLDVFATSVGTPAITLHGSENRISTYGDDGLEQIRLWGSSFGEVLLFNNTPANAIAGAFSANGSVGGRLRLNNTNASVRAELLGANTGGLLTLYQADGGIGVQVDGDDTGAGSITVRSTNQQIRLFLDGNDSNGGAIWAYNTNGSGRALMDGYGFGGGGSFLAYQNDGAFGAYLLGDDSGAGSLYLYQADGSIGVFIDGDSGGAGLLNLRNTNGSNRVTLDGQSIGGGGEISVFDATGTETVEILGAESSTEGGQIALRKADGTTTILIDADFNGDGRITTQELEITGGSDLSEQFDIKAIHETIRPGMLVCIDPERPGELVMSTKAYDRTAAGVVSGAGGVKPGMLMGQKGTKADGRHPVALTGRVYCMVDASHGPIKPGDLITTSDTPGHGMKVEDHSRAQGAIIGKAMTPLASGKGLVLVLVSLQ
jgi:hypothetical protein